MRTNTFHAAFRQLLEQQCFAISSIQHYVISKGGDLSDAKNIRQETLLLFWENLQAGRFEWRSEGCFSSYLFGIARRQWSKELRRRRREDAALHWVQWQPMASPPNQEALFFKTIEEEKLEAFSTCFERLDARSRRLLEGRHVEGLSYSALAEELGLASGQVARQRAYVKRGELRGEVET